MCERFAVDKSKVFRVRGKKEVVRQAKIIAYRADYEALCAKKEVLAVDEGNGLFYLVKPIGNISFLRKGCVQVIGPAPPKVDVYFKKQFFVSRG